MKKIFLNSLPKSGTNLLAKCLELLGYRQSGGVDASLILSHSALAMVRRLYLRPIFSSGYLVGIDMPVELSRRGVEKILAHARNGEFVTGHVGYTPDLLNRIKSMGYAPMLMLRDPRAVLNSFVHYVVSSKRHALHKTFQPETEENRYRLALNGVATGKIRLQPLHDRCKAMDVWMSNAAVLTLRFEDLVGTSGGGDKESQELALDKLISFLGIKDVCIPDIAEKVFGPGRHTFRKGSILGWRGEMPITIQHEVNETMNDVLIGWGYEK